MKEQNKREFIDGRMIELRQELNASAFVDDLYGFANDVNSKIWAEAEALSEMKMQLIGQIRKKEARIDP